MSEVKISNVAMAAAESWFHGTSVPRLLVDGVAERFQSAIKSATAELRRELEEVKRQLWGAERRVVNLETERDTLKREVEELRRREFARGYYCAVAVLVKEQRGTDTLSESLFRAGGDPTKADECDQETFREYGLMPDAALNQREK